MPPYFKWEKCTVIGKSLLKHKITFHDNSEQSVYLNGSIRELWLPEKEFLQANFDYPVKNQIASTKEI
jgi:hypothetical protein